MLLQRERTQITNKAALSRHSKRSNSTVLGFSFLLLLFSSSESFELGKLFDVFKLKAPSAIPGMSNPAISQTKKELLSTISKTGNGKDASLETQKAALQCVRYLETNAPVPSNLLEDPEAAKALDGLWYLQYTAPSDVDLEGMDPWNPENSSEGDSQINTQKANIQGSVRAGGFTVDTSNRPTTQTIDVQNQKVYNTVEQDFGTIKVGGSFRVSDTVKTRAVVAFDTADIQLGATNGGEGGFVVKLGFLFSIIAALRGGKKDNGWLETTFVDDEIRIGRGNKGSLFVLTRDKDAVLP